MKKLYVVIDMQHDFVDGSLANPMAQAIVKPLSDHVKQWLDQGEQVVYTMDTHDEHYLSTQEGQRLPVVHCIKATKGWELVEPLNTLLRSSLSFEKPTFGSTTLAAYAKDYDAIYLCGVCTDICVISNAMLIKANNPQARIVIYEDLCAGVSEQSHHTALQAMANCQMDIVHS